MGIEKLFASFDQALKDRGYLAMSGQIVDASIISALRQRMTKEEKEIVKDGKIPETWKTNPSKLAQKDRDARWVMKYKKAKTKAGEEAVDIAIPYVWTGGAVKTFFCSNVTLMYSAFDSAF